jgi:hypothetical protein
LPPDEPFLHRFLPITCVFASSKLTQIEDLAAALFRLQGFVFVERKRQKVCAARIGRSRNAEKEQLVAGPLTRSSAFGIPSSKPFEAQPVFARA